MKNKLRKIWLKTNWDRMDKYSSRTLLASFLVGLIFVTGDLIVFWIILLLSLFGVSAISRFLQVMKIVYGEGQ